VAHYNNVDTNLASLRERVNEGFENIGVNFDNIEKCHNVNKDHLVKLCKEEFGLMMNRR
jgi:hypothetical protein